jgi:hypothetical protein
MGDVKEIEAAISKAIDYIASTQLEDGSWPTTEAKHNEPQYLQKVVVVTAQLTASLIRNPSQSNISAIMKGLNYCLNYDFDTFENVDNLALLLLTLRFSSTPLAKRTCDSLYKLILTKQTKQSYWKSMGPYTFNLANFLAVTALNTYNPEKDLSKIAGWFKKNRARDGLAWGMDNHAKQSEPSFTANVALASLHAAADPTEEYLQKARKFLESKQFKNGGWYSSSFTIKDKPTTYSTALCVKTLILLSGDISNKSVVNGIKFLLKIQNPKGYWSLVEGEELFVPYTTNYVLNTLNLYLFLKKIWRNAELVKLKENLLKPQYLMLYLYNRFEEQTKTNLFQTLYANLLKSKFIGATAPAIERRTAMLKVLGENGEMDVAEIIDELKKSKKYSFLNKRAYYTQIKADSDFLVDLNLIKKRGEKYFSVFDLSNTKL